MIAQPPLTTQSVPDMAKSDTSNTNRWVGARFTRSTQINAQAAKIEDNRSRYEQVSKATGVPWDVIGRGYTHG